MKQYVLALDQGTTSSRAVIFDLNAKMIGMAQAEVKQIVPQQGWLENDPKRLFKVLIDLIYEVIKKTKISITQIATIGVTNQRETIVVWEKSTGKPIYNAISWKDNRTSEYCQELREDGHAGTVKKKTGLVLDSYFSASKIKWILDNVSGARRKAEEGELLCGTIDTWIIWNLTNRESHITDFSNASRTMLFNISELQWDEDLLEIFSIPREMLPDVTHSGYYFGDAHLNGATIQITGVVGDQQASLFGHGCFEPGDVKNTYGTGCFILMNTGEKLQFSNNGLLTTIAWGLNGTIEYALEGSVFIAGSAVQWLRDGLKMIESVEESEIYARRSSRDNGVYVVPCFHGLGAPFWDMYARGGVFGLSADSTNEDIIKGTLDSMAYQTRDALGSMMTDSGLKINNLRVDGGASSNDYLMQFQSDIMNVPVTRPKNIETTSFGVALIAGITAGIWKKDSALGKISIDKTFKPSMDEYMRVSLYTGWHNAVKRCMNWAKVT